MGDLVETNGQNLPEEQKVKIKEFLKDNEGKLIVLQDAGFTKETLIAIAKKHEDLHVTSENFEEGKLARAEIREFRYALQNILKNNKDFINSAKNNMETEFKEFIDLLKPTEDKIDEQIKAIENEKKLEKERKEKEEQERISTITKSLSDIRFELEKMTSFARTDEEFEKLNEFYNSIIERKEQDEFQEFTFDVDNILSEYGPKFSEVRSRIDKIKEDAEKEAKLKEEQELFRKQKEKEAEETAKEQEKLRLEKEQFEKERREFEEAKRKEEEQKLAEQKAKEEAEAKAKAEAEQKQRQEKVFLSLIEEANNIGATFFEIDKHESIEEKIEYLKLRNLQRHEELSKARTEELKIIAKNHIAEIEPYQKAIHDYFAGVPLAKEHENFIIEFEDKIRLAYKQLKNSIL